LSFNLFNEPHDVSAAAYTKVVAIMATAIRQHDPDRLIIADGLNWGSSPVPELKDLRVAEATRGYAPSSLTHYHANWVEGADRWPKPTRWPPPSVSPYLYGSNKRDLQGPLKLQGVFPRGTRLRVHIDVVSISAEFVIKSQGKVVFKKSLVSGRGEGEWKKAVFNEKYKIYQNVFDKDYSVELSDTAKVVELSIGAGDWLTLSEIGIRPPNAKESVLKLSGDFGIKPGTIYLNEAGQPDNTNRTTREKDAALSAALQPWKQMNRQGVGVMVGEWGAYNETPHDVVLSWMEDCLGNWREAGWGWALWNFRGAFGILDSYRSDVQYEDFHGHKLDRAMLKLLQKN